MLRVELRMVWVLLTAVTLPGRDPLAAAPAIRFEQNLGQTDAEVRFVARTRDAIVYLAPGEVVLQRAASVVRMRVVGGSPWSPIEGEGSPVGGSRYYLGNDPSCWPPPVPAFASVRYRELQPGIDMVLRTGPEGLLEYDFEVEPGASPDAIALEFEGASQVRLEADGSLLVSTAAGELRQRPPVSYQVDAASGCREDVAGRFRLDASGRVGFALGAYDHSRKLVIDPVLRNSTFWGGSDEERYTDIQVDFGFAVVVGSTRSLDYPTSNAVQPALAGGSDAFLLSLDDSGTQVGMSTFIGGSGDDEALDVVKDSSTFSGRLLVTGWTRSSDFPTLSPWQGTHAGGSSDAFVLAINQVFSALDFATYLGGSGEDVGTAVLPGQGGLPVVAGFTDSPDFPLVNAIQSALAGGRDAFLTRYGRHPGYAASSYLGGSGDDQAVAIASDPVITPELHLLGTTSSADFPTSVGAFQGSPGGGRDAFLMRLTTDARTIASSTYFGGSGDDTASDLTINYVTGDAWLIGTTDSPDLPVLGAVQDRLAGATDAFVAELSADGGQLLAATYLGGSDAEEGGGIDLDQDGSRLLLFLSGTTRSSDFPTRMPYQPDCASCPAARDAFWAYLSADTTELRCASYFGGLGDESDVRRIKSHELPGSHYAWFGGTTRSPVLPLVDPIQSGFGGGPSDVFLARLGCDAAPRDIGNVLLATHDRSAGELVFTWQSAPGVEESTLYSSLDKAIAPATLAGATLGTVLRLPLPPEARLYYRVHGANCCGEGP